MAPCDSPWRRARLGDLTPAVDERPDGTVILRAVQPLGDYPTVLTDRLAHWARHAPDRTLLAWNHRQDEPRTTQAEPRTTRTTRIESGTGLRSFERLTYGDALEKVRCLGQALLDCHLTADRPLAILSGNSVEHLLLALAAQHVGVPYAPDLAGLFAGVDRFHRAQARPRAPVARPRVRVGSRALRASPGRGGRARCRGGARRIGLGR